MIQLHKPYFCGDETKYLSDTMVHLQLSGNWTSESNVRWANATAQTNGVDFQNVENRYLISVHKRKQ